jgi:hypothetical protein
MIVIEKVRGLFTVYLCYNISFFSYAAIACEEDDDKDGDGIIFVDIFGRGGGGCLDASLPFHGPDALHILVTCDSMLMR